MNPALSEGTAVADALVDLHRADRQPNLNGFTRTNFFTMRKFYATRRDEEKVAPLVRQIPVELAMSRTHYPALVAGYRARLPDKKLLQAKLHKFHALTESASQDYER